MEQTSEMGGLTWSVVTSVAEIHGVDPTEVEPPLGTVVDGDALESLVTSMTRGSVTFQYSGCEVTVAHDGSVDAHRALDEVEL